MQQMRLPHITSDQKLDKRLHSHLTMYRMAGKFGGNLIWRISVQFHLADFKLAVLFLQAMMSYVIVTRYICNLNAPPSSKV